MSRDLAESTEGLQKIRLQAEILALALGDFPFGEGAGKEGMVQVGTLSLQKGSYAHCMGIRGWGHPWRGLNEHARQLRS